MSAQAEQAPAPIEVDSNLVPDGDSSYGDEVSTYTASLTSSIRNYRYENGRRYHAYREGSYLLPNDESENDRLDIHNHLMTLLLDGNLHMAPIGKNPQRILDIGTGTGIWAIEMGDMYPSAEIIGVDFSPIQPSMVPPNVRFIIDDVEDEWAYESPFDYIHTRYMTCSIKDWPRLVQRTFENTKPGGWAEYLDWDIRYQSSDGSLNDTSLLKFDQLLLEAFGKIGHEPNPGAYLKNWMIDAGFKSVTEKIIAVPLGPWPKEKKLKEIGAWNLLQCREGLAGFMLAPYTRVLGWTAEEVEVFTAKVRNDLKDSRIHSYCNFHIVWGQKPEKSDQQDATT